METMRKLMDGETIRVNMGGDWFRCELRPEVRNGYNVHLTNERMGRCSMSPLAEVESYVLTGRSLLQRRMGY